MSAGRKSKPTALKKLEGTFRADRALPGEMIPSKMEFAPTAPRWMTKEAKKEWISTCNELLSLDMLHRVDLGLLAGYCSEMSQYIEATKHLNDPDGTGPVIRISREDGTSYQMPSPWVSIKNSALKNAQSIASQFGFTPSARTKIRGDVKGSGDPFEDMINHE